MKPSRESIASEAEVYDRALRLLSQKNRSRWEMRRLLEKRCEDGTLIDFALDKCVARGYLDDIKYAVQTARRRVTVKKQGRRRVAQELKSRGIAPAIAEQALDEVFGSLDEDELLRQALEAKLKGTSGSWTRKKVKKIYDQLVRAGFNTDRILRELRRHHISPRELGLSGEELE
ncbi:MAG: recombination regulator RecX [Acidobacteriia bacterium]|nr:recombination regulator RecX [Terriglobia bacterium]